jgi:hypothetical protein
MNKQNLMGIVLALKSDLESFKEIMADQIEAECKWMQDKVNSIIECVDQIKEEEDD